MTDTQTEVKPDTADLCSICEKEPKLGRAGRAKMREICVYCAAEMRDNGDCPVCRGVGVLNDKGMEHLATCKGQLPREPKPKKKKAATKTATEMGNEHEAQDRAEERRDGEAFGGVKNVRDMNLEELQARLDGSWIMVQMGSKSKKINVVNIVTLNEDEIELVDAKTRGIRVIDRKKITKLGPQRK